MQSAKCGGTWWKLSRFPWLSRLILECDMPHNQQEHDGAPPGPSHIGQSAHPCLIKSLEQPSSWARSPSEHRGFTRLGKPLPIWYTPSRSRKWRSSSRDSASRRR